MPRLNKFTFYICSIIYLHNQINLLSNDDIHQTFGYFHDNQVIFCVHDFQEKRYSQYHIYSYPCKIKFYNNIKNNFPDGLFKYISEVSLYDEHLFEHEFFLRIINDYLNKTCQKQIDLHEMKLLKWIEENNFKQISEDKQ